MHPTSRKVTMKRASHGLFKTREAFLLEDDDMGAESFKRKLTAILSADVKGYSRLMGEDEVATVKTLETCKGVKLPRRAHCIDTDAMANFKLAVHPFQVTDVG